MLFEYTNSYEGLFYAKYTQGFKSGVINIGTLNDVIDPEYVDSYEIGYKTRFADGRASLRASTRAFPVEVQVFVEFLDAPWRGSL